jgi:hypothetical protein
VNDVRATGHAVDWTWRCCRNHGVEGDRADPRQLDAEQGAEIGCVARRQLHLEVDRVELPEIAAGAAHVQREGVAATGVQLEARDAQRAASVVQLGAAPQRAQIGQRVFELVPPLGICA